MKLVALLALLALVTLPTGATGDLSQVFVVLMDVSWQRLLLRHIRHTYIHTGASLQHMCAKLHIRSVEINKLTHT